MKSFKTIYIETIIEKFEIGRWEVIISDDEKQQHADNLINLVKTAYNNTPMGSFIQTVNDLLPSDWQVINLDSDPEIESSVFYRKNRPNETWVGNKIQGIGHDGKIYNGVKSSKYAVDKIVELVNEPGWWIEVSDALRSVLLNRYIDRINIIKDVELLKKLYKDPNLKMLDDYTYRRTLSNNDQVIETTVGYPILK
jgi:hypothetical protein